MIITAAIGLIELAVWRELANTDRVELAIAAGQPVAAGLAGRLGDALVTTAPDSDVVEKFEQAGGNGKP